MSRRHQWRRVLLWAAILALLSLPFLVTFFPHREARGKELSPSELMVKAAIYANESLVELNKALVLDKPDAESLAMDSVAARNVSEALARRAANTPDTGLAGFLKKAMLAYADLANASSYTMVATPRLYEGLLEARKALIALKECKVDKYLELYGKARAKLLEADKPLLEALSLLVSLNESYLLSPVHEEIAENLTASVAAAAKTIKELEKLYNIVKSYRDTIEKLCQGRKPSPSRLQGLASSISKLNPGNAGPLGYEEAEAISHILSLMKGQAQCNKPGAGSGSGTSSAGSGEGGRGGSGAGYGEPSSDD